MTLSLAGGVLILEDWDFRTSSPFPDRHNYLHTTSLLEQYSSVPVLSVPRMSQIERERFLKLRSFVSTVSGRERAVDLNQWSKTNLRVDCGNFPCVNINRSTAVYLNDAGHHSRDVQVFMEELTYSKSGLYMLARSERREESVNLKCRGELGLRLSSLFCEAVPEFWHLEYLHNYSCCTESRRAVLSPEECHGKVGGYWGGWSRWGEEERVLVGDRPENVSRRYRLSRSGLCVFIMVDTRYRMRQPGFVTF